MGTQGPPARWGVALATSTLVIALVAGACGDDGEATGGSGGGGGQPDCSNLPRDCDGQLVDVALDAVEVAATRVQEVTATLAARCRAIVVSLGGSPDELPSTGSLDDAEAWCNAAGQRLGAIDGSITVWQTVCLYELEPLAACEAACSGVEACEARPGERCSLPAGSCASTCSGLCIGATGPAECEGNCAGGCTGTCGGPAIDDGVCNSGCSGTCSGSCTLASSCSQVCAGSCDGDLQDGRCAGRPLPPKAPCDVCEKCSEACAWRSNLGARCLPSPVVVDLVNDDPLLQEALRAALVDAFTTRADIELVLAPELLWLWTFVEIGFDDPTTKACAHEAAGPVAALNADVDRLTVIADGLLAATAQQ